MYYDDTITYEGEKKILLGQLFLLNQNCIAHIGYEQKEDDEERCQEQLSPRRNGRTGSKYTYHRPLQSSQRTRYFCTGIHFDSLKSESVLLIEACAEIFQPT